MKKNPGFTSDDYRRAAVQFKKHARMRRGKRAPLSKVTRQIAETLGGAHWGDTLECRVCTARAVACDRIAEALEAMNRHT
jgi:hypothetical protein